MEQVPAAQAVESLIDEYHKLVFHTIYAMTGDWEESQDLTQDTFHQALKAIDTARAVSGEDFRPKAWLLRIALNTVRMQRRRRALFRFIPFSSLYEEKQQDNTSELRSEDIAPVQPGGYGATGGSDPAEMIAEQDVVQRTLARLSEDLRVCLLLSIVGGLSSYEIARLLELKEAAVRKRLERARKQFQQVYISESGEQVCDTPSLATRAHPKDSGKERTEPQTHSDQPQRLTLAPLSSPLWRHYA